MWKRWLLVGAVLALLGAALAPAVAQTAVPGPVLQRIRDRGRLICGVNRSLPGFGVEADDGAYSGFEVDWCRAVAVAVLNDASAVDFVPVLDVDDIPALMADGAVDLITRLFTVNFTRSAIWGAEFAPPTFFDGQTAGVQSSLGIASLDGLDGRTVCVAENAPAQVALPDEAAERGLSVTVQAYPTIQDAFVAFEGGECDAVGASIASLSSLRSEMTDPTQMTVLPDTYTLEPSAPLSPAGDPVFSDIVRWTIYGLITADSLGITSQNVDSFLTTDVVEVRDLLGLSENAPALTLGLKADFVVDMLRAVGNYDEIYQRNLNGLGLARGKNLYWMDGGLLYAEPFR